MRSPGRLPSPILETAPVRRRFVWQDARKTAIAFLSGALGIVCVTTASSGRTTETEITAAKHVRESRWQG